MDTEIRDFTWAQRDMDTKIHDLGGKRTSTPWTSTPPRTSTRHGQVPPYGQVPYGQVPPGHVPLVDTHPLD